MTDDGQSAGEGHRVVVDGPEDHDRAARELALSIAGEVDAALADHGHPVGVTIYAEVDDAE